MAPCRYGRRIVFTPGTRPTSPALRDDKQSRRGLDRDHLKRVHLAILAADRNIFARTKGVVAEAIAGLVVVIRRFVIIEHPARVLCPARPVHQPPELVVLASPEPAHAAMLAVFAPKLGIDMPVGIERSNELIAMFLGPQREILRAGEIEPDALEHMRQLGHDGPPRW